MCIISVLILKIQLDKINWIRRLTFACWPVDFLAKVERLQEAVAASCLTLEDLIPPGLQGIFSSKKEPSNLCSMALFLYIDTWPAGAAGLL